LSDSNRIVPEDNNSLNNEKGSKGNSSDAINKPTETV